MRIVLVNHCHPESPHVCAVRARSFAEALAARGHAVVLLTESLTGDDPAEAPEALSVRIENHDWSTPLTVAVTPRPSPLLDRARSGGLGPLNKSVLALAYLFRGEVYGGWTGASRPYWPVLATVFRPDVVWGTFGNTGVLRIARGIAHKARAPWVLDVKDPWSNFIPDPLHRLIAAKFNDACAITALSAGHGEDARRWFRRSADVIHSGLPAALLRREDTEPPASRFRLTLTGSLYGQVHLDLFADGLRRWLRERERRQPVQLDYYGGDAERAEAAFAPLRDACIVRVHGTVPLDRLIAVQTGAHANAFIANKEVLFHHKIFELAAAGRPVLAVPGASPEERNVMTRLGGRLHGCADADTLARTLAMLETQPLPERIGLRGRLAAFTWEEQAKKLEAVLQEAVP